MRRNNWACGDPLGFRVQVGRGLQASINLIEWHLAGL
jgi:hypothetical protein